MQVIAIVNSNDDMKSDVPLTFCKGSEHSVHPSEQNSFGFLLTLRLVFSPSTATKDVILAMITHDSRTPIGTYFGLLSGDLPDPGSLLCFRTICRMEFKRNQS